MHKNIVNIMMMGMAMPSVWSCSRMHTKMAQEGANPNVTHIPMVHRDHPSNNSASISQPVELEYVLDLAHDLVEVVDDLIPLIARDIKLQNRCRITGSYLMNLGTFVTIGGVVGGSLMYTFYNKDDTPNMVSASTPLPSRTKRQIIIKKCSDAVNDFKQGDETIVLNSCRDLRTNLRPFVEDYAEAVAYLNNSLSNTPCNNALKRFKLKQNIISKVLKACDNLREPVYNYVVEYVEVYQNNILNNSTSINHTLHNDTASSIPWPWISLYVVGGGVVCWVVGAVSKFVMPSIIEWARPSRIGVARQPNDEESGALSLEMLKAQVAALEKERSTIISRFEAVQASTSEADQKVKAQLARQQLKTLFRRTMRLMALLPDGASTSLRCKWDALRQKFSNAMHNALLNSDEMSTSSQSCML